MFLYASYKKNKRKIFKLQEILFTKAFSFKRKEKITFTTSVPKINQIIGRFCASIVQKGFDIWGVR